jgi:uncharacterized protein
VDVAGITVSLPGVLALGLMVGFVAGMFGVGGGFLLTPLLSVLFGLPMPVAVGTGLCQMVGTATVATLRYRRLGQGEPRFAIVMIAGSLVGVGAGTRVVSALEAAGVATFGGATLPIATVVLYAGYVAFLVAIGLVLLRQSRGGVDELDFVRRGWLARLRLPPFIDLPGVPLPRVSVLAIAYVGLLIGLLSGVLGVGGGMALIPILLYGFGFPFRAASGTGVEVVLLTSIVGTVAHALGGRVHLGLALLLLVGSGITAQLGAIVTSRLSARPLRRGLAVLIAITIALIVGDVARLVRVS